MSLCVLYIAETLAILFMIISAIIAVIDSLQEFKEKFEAKEAEKFDDVLYDDFEMLYINVAGGDRSDCGYWLDSVKGMQNLTKGTENDEKI